MKKSVNLNKKPTKATYSAKIIMSLICLIFILKVISCEFNTKNIFNSDDYKKSIYFSDIDPLSGINIEDEIEKPHKIDLMLLKLENKFSLKNNYSTNKNFRTDEFKKSKTFMNMKFSKNFYDINFCIDEIDSPNKNQFFKNINEIKINKKIKIKDISHSDLINYLLKFDFSEINPKNYNELKTATRYSQSSKKAEETNDDEWSSIYGEQVKSEFEKCFKKFEYLNDDSPRYGFLKSETFNLIKILNNTKIRHENELENDYFFDEFTNIKFGDTLMKIIKSVNELIKWEEENFIIELNFIFNNANLANFLRELNDIAPNSDENMNIFLLNKIFVYYMKMPKLELDRDTINTLNLDVKKIYEIDKNLKGIATKDNYISLIRNHQTFENIFIDSKVLSKRIKFTKNNLQSKNSKISTKSLNESNIGLSLIKTFWTLENESIFHNRLHLNIDLLKFKDKILSSNKNNKVCLLFFQQLTEDLFIEKNEFKEFIDKNLRKFERYYFFSDEIDQEVSSDISKQYFLSFILCSNNDYFKNNIFTKENNNIIHISYPIHFRYQPPLYFTTHQEVFITLPSVDVLIQEEKDFSLEKNIINNDLFISHNNHDKFVYRDSRNKLIKDERKIFSQDIHEKLMYLIEKKQIGDSLNKVRHFIPIGQMNHFYVVVIITFLIAFIGFFIVLCGIINNKIK